MANRSARVVVGVLLLAGCGGSKQELPASTFAVDPALKPWVDEVAGHDGGPPRKVAAMRDQYGTQAEFVEDELIVVTDDQPALDALLARWNGKVLDTVRPADAGVQDVPAIHLVQVKATAADAKQLAEDFKKLVPDARNDLAFDSQAGLDLAAVAGREGVAGARLSFNWVLRPQALEGPAITEAPSGIIPKGAWESPAYDSNPLSWPYMQKGGPVDTGVTEAWRALALGGRLGNKVNISILDGGFLDNQDLAGSTAFGGFGVMNPASCSGGTPCPWHGTGSAIAAFGEADDGYGAAGPAGPVARRILVESPSDFWSTLKYPFTLLGSTAPRVINISAAAILPAVAAGFAKPALSIVSFALRQAGMLVVAAAGNDGLDLDAEDCFIVCWHKRTAIPCELGNVLCVGAMEWNSRTKASYSNYGSNVDLYAPGGVWVLDTQNASTANRAAIDDGTSVASPFVAGVAGLVLAANPGLGPSEVDRILGDTAHRDNGEHVSRAVNAWAAVSSVLGPQPPVIRLGPNPGQAPLRGEVHLYSVNRGPLPGDLLSVFMPESDVTYLPDVRVTSDLDGDLGLPATHVFATPGRRTLTVTARRNGLSAQAVLPVDVVNVPPTLTNATAPTSVGLGEGWSLVTPVVASDANEPPSFRLGCDRVRWSVSGPDLLGLSPGCDTFVVFGAEGTRQVTATATDSDGATTSTTFTVSVGPRPAQIPPAVSGFVVREGSAVLQDGLTVSSPGSQLVATATLYNPDNVDPSLSWSLDDGTTLRSDALTVSGAQREVVTVDCSKLESKRYFLQLFRVTNTPSAAKKRFTFDVPVPQPR